MSGAIYMGASGAILQQTRLDILSDNLSNINTAGFKKNLAVFRIREMNTGEQTAGPGHALSSLPVLPLSTEADFSTGPLKTTGNPMDAALNGDGFFCIQTPEGVQYTRQGNFTVNAAKQLVTSDNMPVLGESGPILIDGRELTIDPEGNILVDGDSADSLRIADFPRPYSLKKAGNTRFISENPNIPENRPGNTSVIQGALELSNTDPIESLVKMIESQRFFASCQKVISTTDNMNQKAVNELGRIA
ncbi:MAG: flagellar hook-basal body protein [Desulfococcaceae bacterium]|jgi:flagellar basal-body rod protein FlgG|nr:flagellar hook-basal body protein [Desulfococcaceae bacterium]